MRGRYKRKTDRPVLPSRKVFGDVTDFSGKSPGVEEGFITLCRHIFDERRRTADFLGRQRECTGHPLHSLLTSVHENKFP